MENANTETQRARRVELEEALEIAGFGKFHFGVTAVCAVIISASIVETMSTGFILPAAQCDLGLTSGQKGILTASTFTGMIVSAHTWGVIADTTGRRKVLLVSLSAAALFSLASAFAFNFWLLSFLRLMVGLLISGSSAAVYTYLGEFSSLKSRSKSIAWACIAFPVSMFTMPGVGWAVLPLDFDLDIFGLTFRSWRLFVMILGIPGAIGFFSLLRYPESPKFLVSVGRTGEALDILQNIYRANHGQNGSKFPVSEIIAPISRNLDQDPIVAKSGVAMRVIRTMWNQTIPLFLPPYGFITLLACAMQFGIFFSFNGMYLWMPEILNQVALFNKEHPGLPASICDAYAIRVPEVAENITITIVPEQHTCHRHLDSSVFMNTMTTGGASLVVYLTVGFIVSLISKRTIIITAQTISGLAGIGLLFVNHSALISTMIIIYHVISGVCLSLLTSIVVDLYPTNLRTMAVCITLVTGRFGTVAVGNLIALLIEIDCSLTMSIMACVPLTCAILCFFVPRGTDNSAVQS